MIKLSVVIITFNEERNIGRCISSVKDIADEIIVVDSYSTDKTQEICEKLGVQVIQQAFLGYQDQKNFANSQARNETILSLDADEVLSQELLVEIKAILLNFEFNAYKFNRLTNYCGHWVKFCGWNPDIKVRLYQKSKAHWSGGNIHESIEVCGTIGKISGDLLHYSYPTITSHINQTNKFSTLSALELHKAGKKSSLFKIITRPIFKFLRDYFFKLGFLDGRYGFIICCINALSALLKYSKLYDLQNGKEI